MTINILIFTLILASAFILFAKEVFAHEISALLVLIALTLSGLIKSNSAFESFGNHSIFLIASLFILIAGLRKTGVVNRIESLMGVLSDQSRRTSMIVVLLVVGTISIFISNTATLAVCIPIVSALAKRYGDSPRLWLLPVAYASVLGGMNSLIGTSTNIIISSLLPDFGIQTLGLFTTALVGLPIFLLGLAYLLWFSPVLLGQNSDIKVDSIQVKYDLRSYTSEIEVNEKSPLCNKSLSDTPLFREAEVVILNIMREGSPVLYPHASFVIKAKDLLLVEGNINKLTSFIDTYGLRFSEENKTDSKNKISDIEFHEVLVVADSCLNGRRPAGVALRNRYSISLIAINRNGVTLRDKLSDVRIQAGDILVVQFLQGADNELLDFLGLIPLQKLKQARLLSDKAWQAVTIFVLAIVLGSFTSIPIAITCLAGAISLPIFGILKLSEFYAAIEWKILIFIGAVLSLGKAMVASGTADYIGHLLSQYLMMQSPLIGIAFFFLLTVFLTSLLSNQATAVVVIPLAINTARALGVDPMPFIMTVTIAASCCFMTPFEPVFMLVYGLGNYKFKDFIRMGLILNLIAFLIVLLFVPFYWKI